MTSLSTLSLQIRMESSSRPILTSCDRCKNRSARGTESGLGRFGPPKSSWGSGSVRPHVPARFGVRYQLEHGSKTQIKPLSLSIAGCRAIYVAGWRSYAVARRPACWVVPIAEQKLSVAESRNESIMTLIIKPPRIVGRLSAHLVGFIGVSISTNISPHCSSNWPEYRGPSGDGTGPQADLPTAIDESVVQWIKPIHGIVLSSPVVWENEIWLSTATEVWKQMSVICVDRLKGKVLHDKVLF